MWRCYDVVSLRCYVVFFLGGVGAVVLFELSMLLWSRCVVVFFCVVALRWCCVVALFVLFALLLLCCCDEM